MSATSTTGRAALVAANGRARRPAEPPQGELSHAEAQRGGERRDFWFGEVPDGWEVKRLASYFSERKVKVSDKDFPPLSVTKNGILPQLENVAKTDDGDNRKLVRKGDFVINSRSDRKGSSGLSEYDGSVSLINLVLKPRGGLFGAYCNYLLKSLSFVEENYRNGRGIVADLWTTRYDEMKMIKVAMPPLPEQKAIVAYLDAETGRIDKAIAAEEKMIALLQERREIVINEAVGGGDLSHAEAQRGRVRRGWEVRRLKSLLRPHKILVGKHCNEYDLLSLTLRGIVKRDMDNPEGKFPASFETYQEVNPGEFVFCMFDNEETPRAVGLSSLRGMITGAYDVMSLIDSGISSKYLNYYFLWIDDGKRLKPLYKGLRKTVPLDSFMTYKIPLPPLPEQEAIVERLDRETGKIDRAIEVKRRQIELLRERRQIVIDEVVTGKVKVA